jgi:hypothetical protein
MLRVMLCGAGDTEDVVEAFSRVVAAFGGEPWHYQSGQVYHVNSLSASWDTNSRVTVKRADLCIFVIVRKHGEITWSAELREALNSGKPFIVMCLADTYRTYLTLRRSIADLSAISNDDDRALLSLLRELESEREFTIVPFTLQLFGDVLRKQMSNLFSSTLDLLANRNQRSVYIKLLADPAALNTSDLIHISEVAVDELENKNVRKRAILALAARRAADEETLMALLNSAEQGVQRLTIQHLRDMYTKRPADPEFLGFCVDLANSSDDLGVNRRLIPAILEVDLDAALTALLHIRLVDGTARRKLAEAIEIHESQIIQEGLQGKAILLLDRCMQDPGVSDWRERCRLLHERFNL